jgi:hypothetical protein
MDFKELQEVRTSVKMYMPRPIQWNLWLQERILEYSYCVIFACMKRKESGKIIQLPSTLNHASANQTFSAISPKRTILFTSIVSYCLASLLELRSQCHGFFTSPFQNALLPLFVLAWFRWDQFQTAHPLTEAVVVKVNEAALQPRPLLRSKWQ